MDAETKEHYEKIAVASVEEFERLDEGEKDRRKGLAKGSLNGLTATWLFGLPAACDGRLVDALAAFMYGLSIGVAYPMARKEEP